MIETDILKQACAAVLLAEGHDRRIYRIYEATIILLPIYPRGTRYFLIASQSQSGGDYLDSVYWRDGRCVVVSEKEIWRVSRAAVIEGLLQPIRAKEGNA